MCCHIDTERGDQDFCLSRLHYTDTDPTSKERTPVEDIEPTTSWPGATHWAMPLPTRLSIPLPTRPVRIMDVNNTNAPYLPSTDMDLEAQAKVWAEKCVFAHEHVKGRGENLAFSTYHHSETQLIDEAYQAWFDEKKDYKKGQKGCQRSCHYTQVRRLTGQTL